MIFRVRAIPSCPGYFVSDTGRVWGPRKELKLRMRGKYLIFSRRLHDRVHDVRVAYIVAEAFLGPKPPGAWVCHRNDVSRDNRVENLYYGNPSTNLADAYRNRRRSSKGEKGANAKLTWKQVKHIRQQFASGAATQAELARKHGVVPRTIRFILDNTTWKGKLNGHG